MSDTEFAPAQKTTLSLLVVDDDQDIRDLMADYLRQHGFAVRAADGGDAMFACIEEEKPDLIVLDIMMPGEDGLSLCRRLRAMDSSTPVIFLTALGDTADRVVGLELGADDYVVKPFSPRELMLRVSAVLRRAEGHAAKEEKKGERYVFEGLDADMTARIVKIDGEAVGLSPKEYDLLFYMIRNRGIALTREKLICDVWGYDFYGGDRTLDTHIKLLRKSLGPYSKFITTLWGVGYRFDEPKK